MNTSQTIDESPAKKGPIVAWILVLFALTILCALPLIFGGVGLRKLSPSAPLFGLSIAGFTLAGCAPTIAALLVAGFYPGAGGARVLLRQVKTWRVGLGWYALVLIGPIVLYLLANVIHILFRGTPPQHWLRFPSLSYMGPGGLVWLVVQLMVGSLGEEYGWRGFGQPRLQSLYGALSASVFVGILWSTWHIWSIIPQACLAA